MIIGWATKPTIGRELVLDALLMAVRRRRIPNRTDHSARTKGSQYGKRRLAALLPNQSISEPEYESDAAIAGTMRLPESQISSVA